MKVSEEKRIFAAYEIGLLVKGIQAVLEIAAGVVMWVISVSQITAFLIMIANGEIGEISNDSFSQFLLKSADQFSPSGKIFIAFYLLSHGLVKIIIISGLFLRKQWAYPAAFIGLGGLILYQVYRLILHYSIVVLIFTLVDVVILWLIWREHNLETLTK